MDPLVSDLAGEPCARMLPTLAVTMVLSAACTAHQPATSQKTACISHAKVQICSFSVRSRPLTRCLPILCRLVQMFGSTRRKRQLASREEGTVNPDKLLSADATERMLAGVNAAAHASGLTRDKVCLLRCAVTCSCQCMRQVNPCIGSVVFALQSTVDATRHHCH